MTESSSSATFVDGIGTTSTTWMSTWYAPTIRVGWHKSDQVRWANELITSTPTASMRGPSFTPTIDSPASTMPTGAEAGIGVGAAIVTLVAFGIMMLLLRRKRSEIRRLMDANAGQILKAELPGAGKEFAEIGGEDVIEMGGQGRPHEAKGDIKKAELESDWAGWEAPALVEVELSRAPPDPRAANLVPVFRDSIQDKPVHMVARR